MSRPFDRFVAGAALCVLSPVLVLIAVFVRASMGRPVLFTQQRAGLQGKAFRLIKFRTMTDAREVDGTLRTDDERLTRVGRWLRRTSLDELPELWNVVRGEMALVGPRPLPTQYLSRYTAEEARRHEVLPGVTGWAQVNGRNQVGWDDRLALDVWYVDHRSWWLDMCIIGRTVRTVIRREGISGDGVETMQELRPNLATAEDRSS